MKKDSVQKRFQNLQSGLRSPAKSQRDKKADCGGQPQEYRKYFEDWTSRSNTACPVAAIAKIED